ncbi:MAG TPA: PSD1 and planctomycete cytochrome C domain-containing protein [Isosphaeraceae bacterium]|nr:PSD1 and planctomycete cytochrome C domain-containing protein [Isosphaeraceae bacterium]
MPHRLTTPTLLACLLVAPAALADDPKPTEEQARFFETKVRPVFADHCAKCHGPDKSKAGLRLDSRAAVLAGGDTGPAVVPGKPDESLLVTAIRHMDDGPKMPPSKKLPDDVVANLTRWVQMGAPWPGDHAVSSSGVRKGEFQITDKDRAHWAFQPVRRPSLPDVKDTAWVAGPIDAFILARLEARVLRPNPPASKSELIRRVTYDLTGLPPTPEEVEAFVADADPKAYERLVDRLLASPRYGEKWGRQWLDLVRFAETNSYERDNPKPNAWRYRDYVIRSFNDDTPYDRFVREQLAGDELPDGGSRGIIATGYYRLGIWDDEPTDRDQAFYDGLDDVVATTGQVFLGLTVDCARCHDHKIDPIAQKDYYRLVSFFRNVNHYRNGGPTDEAPLFDEAPLDKVAYEAKLRVRESTLGQVKARIDSIEKDFLDRDKAADPKKPLKGRDLAAAIRERGEKLVGKDAVDNYVTLRKQLRGMEAEKPAVPTALCVTENGDKAPETFVLLRGNPQNRGDKVEPAFLTVLGGSSAEIAPPPGGKSTGRRRALADWIASADNPLTPRVMANRLWQGHFGRGIVRSSSNFGTQGDKPTHPELLDWLAAEFLAKGWRLKPLHRLILTSNAYKMSSRAEPKALAADPTNDLFWRFDMRRLSAEEIRDSILAVGGNLNLKMYGPGVYPEIPAEVLAGQSIPGNGWGKSSPEESARRSVYVHVKRSLVMPILESFDLAETDRSTPVRFATTQPTQALGMLNGTFLRDQSRLLSARVRRESGGDRTKQVERTLRLVTCRKPADAEVRRGLDLISGLESGGMKPDDALASFCLVALNLNEFLYLD